MNIVYILIPVSLVLVGLAIWAFFWAVGSGQYDDLDTPALRVLSDDEEDDSEPPSGSDRS